MSLMRYGIAPNVTIAITDVRADSLIFGKSELARHGYKQELRRDWSPLQVC